MQTIALQPTSKSVVVVNKVESSIAEYLNLSITDGVSGKNMTIDVLNGHIFSIVYVDSDHECQLMEVIGKVINLNWDSITLRVIRGHKGVCLCANAKNLAGLVDIDTVCVPVNNITMIQELKEAIKPTCKEVNFVAVLGLSAEIIRSIVVRLRIYDDTIKKCVIPVDMAVGKYYHVTYFNHKDHTVYEIEGKLTDIRIEQKCDAACGTNGYVRPEPPKKQECVGLNNSVYDSDHFLSLEKEPNEGERIVFAFDTSTEFESVTDYVHLRDIRCVVEIDESGTPITPEPQPSPEIVCPGFPWIPCCNGNNPATPADPSHPADPDFPMLDDNLVDSEEDNGEFGIYI